MERLQKVLAQAGIASRRAAEQIILAGRVRVDGKIVRELGTQVDPRKSRVEVDGNKIVAEKLIYIVLHKPRGVVCTLSDPEGRPTISELLKDAGARVVPVGRLDFHTSGALLCTNDGEFAQALAHPTKAVPKVYVAKVKGAVDDEALDRFSERIVIDGRPTQPAQVKRLRFEGDKTWLEITLREGRNRQVRRLGEATGFPVMRLARISHAGVTSEDLRPGQWRPLSVDELVELKRDYGVPKKVRAPQFEPALGKGGWSDEPRAPGARRPDPKFSAAKRRDTKAREPKREPKQFEASRAEAPRFDRKRSAANREDAPRAEPPRFDRKRSAANREDAPRAEPPRFDRKRSAPRRDAAPAPEAKPFNAKHREKKRFNAKNAEPKPFEPRERPPNRRGAPFDPKGARGPRRDSPFQREPAQSAGRHAPNRPWEARSRSASEERPGTNSARPSADRASGHKGRAALYAKRGGEKNQNPAAPYAKRGGEKDQARAPHAKNQDQATNKPSQRKPTPASRSDARGSAPRRGTSR
jgi:23S rRNA pseudouridine2605 synthase